MTAQATRRMRLLSTLHLLAVLALAAWWGAYFWAHSPACRAWRAGLAGPRASSPEVVASIEGQLDRATRLLHLAAADLAFGAGVLVMVALGTGTYVRRLEIWLEARTSGQAVSFGADGLEGQALAANADRIGRGP
jgi:hypothetical protein